jgi:hypothetical protein
MPKLDGGQSRSIPSMTIGEPVSLEMVHSAIVLFVLNPPILICGQTSGVGVSLGRVVGVLDGVRVTVGVKVDVGGTVGVRVLVALGAKVGVRDGTGVIEGVTPGSNVAVREGVLEGTAEVVGTSVVALVGTIVVALVGAAAAVPVSIEMAVAVCGFPGGSVAVGVSGEKPDSRAIA